MTAVGPKAQDAEELAEALLRLSRISSGQRASDQEGYSHIPGLAIGMCCKQELRSPPTPPSCLPFHVVQPGLQNTMHFPNQGLQRATVGQGKGKEEWKISCFWDYNSLEGLAGHHDS